ncbi:MAG TPA: hypothetical protein ENG95_06715 [Nitrospirae bacterium]|nr:hypothetical protein BMS3Abin10_00294 [bacterium BMS3Abin10]GBE39452.1 hypothetical protein BMS3Bbin08_02075 [bacterium BMS3Bbin08]HDH01357.1 hypothetical protein [Nitrospirota bacterium]HDH51066.1 hypothetical protein [Nitrospirota bacterium]HDK81952.1 hypothetical protein [Nitrospirota bacterium]
MSTAEPLKIISVAGAHSSVGKTTLCTILLKSLKGFGAIKFTKTPLYASVTDDISILDQKGKDTALFLGSGAQKVLWIQSPYHELGDIIKIALGKMSGLKGVVVEGNSPVDFLNPHLILLIIKPDAEIKPSAVRISKKADIIIINSEKRANEPGLAGTVPKNAKVFRIDLNKKRGELDEFLCFVKERIGSE